MDDLANLTTMSEDSLNSELRVRYYESKIYTYVGDILVAVNPYESLPLYSPADQARYRGSSRGAQAPHVFFVADDAYSSAMQSSKDQVCVISGESGAGKTETTKLIIKQLLYLCSGSQANLGKKINDLNPVLEAFGNAQTVMNHNSSRFGKYLELKFDQKGIVSGVVLSDYLLERSRVVAQGSKERNFHVFYYLLDGATPEQKQSLRLGPLSTFRYTNANQTPQDAGYCSAHWQALMKALAVVGFSADTVEDVVRVAAGILHLGNVTFGEYDETEASFVTDTDALQFACQVLQISYDKFLPAVTTKVNKLRGEVITKPYTAQQAGDARDACCKTIYGRQFSWMVTRLNGMLNSAPLEYGSKSIGLLDIFGFENFEWNSFEQLCINLANEQLQAFFNNHIFAMEMKEYMAEGIVGATINFVDNKSVLEAFFGRPLGIMSILDEESKLQSSSADTLLKKLQTHLGKSPSLKFAGDQFKLSHYAGQVTYEGELMIEKNRDFLPEVLSEAIAASSIPLIRTLFSADASLAPGPGANRKSMRKSRRKSRMRAKANAKKPSVGARFSRSLVLLMTKMNPCQPHFVRCIKPNSNAAAKQYDDDYVLKQLRYTGMLETVRVRREGYSSRPTFAEFLERFGVLAHSAGRAVAPTPDNCMAVLNKVALQDWQVGRTKVFLKYYHMDKLAQQVQVFNSAAIVVQKWVRRYQAVKRYYKLVSAYRVAQAAVVGFLKDVKAFSTVISNNLKTLCEEDETRVRQRLIEDGAEVGEQAVAAPNGMLGADLFPKQKVPDFFSRKHQQTMAKNKASARKWFRDTELNRGAVAPQPGDKQQPSRTLSAEQQEQLSASWFRGIIPRDKAEDLLYGKPTGTFLIRVSIGRPGYCVSLVFAGRFKHFRIEVTADLGYVIRGKGKRHNSLHDMVVYHKTVPLSADNDMLLFPLGDTVAPEDDPEFETQYAALLFDKTQIKQVLKAKKEGRPVEQVLKQKKGAPPEPSKDFVKAVAPLVAHDKLSVLDSSALTSMENRFGKRQTGANGAKPYGRPDSVFVPSLPPERPDTAVPRPIGAPPPLPPPRQPSALETLRASAEPQSKLSPTMKNKQMMIIRDAERRIYLAHESLKQKSKGKAKREKKLRKEEKARQKAAEKLKKQQAKHHKKATRVYITDNRGRKSTASVDNHDYRDVREVLKEMEAL